MKELDSCFYFWCFANMMNNGKYHCSSRAGELLERQAVPFSTVLGTYQGTVWRFMLTGAFTVPCVQGLV